jgi:osmoprotectant transport system permease protein
MTTNLSEQLAAQLALLPANLGGHVRLSLAALATALCASLPLGVLAARAPRLRGALLGAASVAQTVPSLALLALMVPVLAWLLPVSNARHAIGFLPAWLALSLYGVLPILRNTVTGIAGVDPDVIEAARGVGMTGGQMLRRVQLPLAAPVIVAGIRTATVWIVGTATLATPVGATSIGNYIFTGLQTQNYVAVVFGCVLAAALAIVLDQGIGALETALAEGRRRRSRALVAGLALLAATALLAPFLRERAAADDGGATLIVGAKPFTESLILAELLAEQLRSAGFAVETRQNLGSTVLYDALAAGSIDVYVDYTGTLWATILKRDDSPGAAAVLDVVTQELAKRSGVAVAGPLGFENTYALALRRDRAEALGVARIGALVPSAHALSVGGDYELFERAEWKRLRESYGLRFREERPMDPTLLYEAARSGAVDVVTAYSTDGRIAAFDLVTLEDERHAFPPYDAVVLLGARAAARPGVLAALRPILGRIDAATMREANRRVDFDSAPVGAAAAELRRRIQAGAGP